MILLSAAKSEVVYLMEALDEDGDKIISVEEVLAEPKTFLESQAWSYNLQT